MQTFVNVTSTLGGEIRSCSPVTATFVASTNLGTVAIIPGDGSPISYTNSLVHSYNNYGTYLYQMERYNDAVEQFRIAGATLGYDQRYQALENLGRIYLKLGDVANAEKTFKQALLANRDSYISMLELAEIFYLQQQIPAATQMYEQYVRTVGQKNQGARALWIGVRVARANADKMGMQVLVNQLRALFPESPEYQRYLQLQYSTEAVWK